MSHKEKEMPGYGTIVLLLVFLNGVILKDAFISNENWYWALFIPLPILLIVNYFLRIRKQTQLKNKIKQSKELRQQNFQIP